MPIKYKKRSIAIDDELWDTTKQFASICGMSVSSYIRFLLKFKQPRARPEDGFWKLYDELNKIGVNINQMAHLAHGTGNVEYKKFEQDFLMIKEIKKRLFDEYVKPEELFDGIPGNTTI